MLQFLTTLITALGYTTQGICNIFLIMRSTIFIYLNLQTTEDKNFLGSHLPHKLIIEFFVHKGHTPKAVNFKMLIFFLFLQVAISNFMDQIKTTISHLV